ncbi:PREDICTED: delta-like protein 4 isoform X2 [Nelumbo nucifera]|uniref:Delta-like protein 4 isoform X2 n=1 Tax=Nelumbo nucifera TaxID=4432 RepID=A0A1U7ZPI2_NELNU|nr:PREDICTED: delta-like protein 4 isoform X2 [Nelumbo nucifera]
MLLLTLVMMTAAKLDPATIMASAFVNSLTLPPFWMVTDHSSGRGRFCDEERIMCDGTNSFWCEHGATCQEIVQGENYTCKCRPGYTGIHCENSGAPCGRIFCFHEAECLVEGETCECPPDWTGSVDCSKPTRSPTDITNSTTNKLPHVEKHNNTKWLAVVLGMLCFVAAVAAVAIYIKRLFKRKEETTLKFQQLSQMQTHDFLDDDDDDENESFVPEIRSDGSQI